METHVEVLVPKHATAKMKSALASERRVARWVKTEPTNREASRVLLAWLEDLANTSWRQELLDLWETTAGRRRERVPLVLLTSEGGQSRWSGRALQELIHLSRRAHVEPYVAPNVDAVRRLLLAREARAERELIASATIEDGTLVVWSCEPKRYEVAAAAIPALAELTPAELAKLEVSASGSRLRWASADIDLDLETIRSYADPKVRRAHELEARAQASRYANAIRVFREERGVKQADVAGLTERQVRRIEQGETIPRVDTLRKLAQAHGLTMSGYLEELAKRSEGPAPKRATVKRRAAPAGRRGSRATKR